jgi:hypothetical protein
MRESRVTEYVTQVRRNVERRRRSLEEDNCKGMWGRERGYIIQVIHCCACGLWYLCNEDVDEDVSGGND